MDRLRELNAGKRDKNLVGRWCIDQSLTDYSGRGNTATNNGSTIVSSSRGPVRSFDGVDDYIGATVDALSYPYTVSCWAMVPSLDTETAVSFANSVNGERFVNLGFGSGGDIRHGIRSDTIPTVTASTTTTYTAGRWHLLTAVGYSATDRRVYLDGGGEGTDTTSRTLLTLNKFRIAAIERSTTLYYEVTVSDVRWHNRALPAAEIRDLYDRTRKPYTPRRRVYSIPSAPPATSTPQLTLLGVG